MLDWIQIFLLDRKINVKIGTTTSDHQGLDNGSPQGSVISPTLFNAIMQTLKDALSKIMTELGIDLSQFADDSAIWKSAKNIKYAIRIIQMALQIIEQWAEE